MCLWFFQECPDCCRVSSLPSADPHPCPRRLCLRKRHDPHFLSEIAYYAFVRDRGPCLEDCYEDECGVMLEKVYCGEDNAVHGKCQGESDSTDSDSTDESDYDKGLEQSLINTAASMPCLTSP